MAKRPLGCNVLLTGRALPACSVRYAVGQLLSMDEAPASIFGPDGALGSASGAMGGELRDGELTSYPNEDDGDN